MKGVATRTRPYCGMSGFMIEIPIITRNTVPESTPTVLRIDATHPSRGGTPP